MKVLIACEESQTVCKAFRERGHEAYSCDIQEPSGGHPEWHILGDAIAALDGGVITTIFFMHFILADIPHIAVENPVGFMNTGYRKPDQIIHPYMFADSVEDGENYHEKRTCLWLKNLPLLKRTSNLPVPPPMYISQGKTPKKIGWCEGMRGTTNGQEGRAKARSKTFSGIAAAMAEQWGGDAKGETT